MSNLLKLIVFGVVGVVLTTCDIQPVSVGEWEISVDTPAGRQPSVWTVIDSGTISMTNESVTVVVAVELEGSRLSWSGEFANLSGQTQNANFSGTVDGNKLEGTIFTTQGNMTVTGSRQ